MPSETALREPSPPDPSPLRPALPRASGERTNSVLLMASRILSRFRAGEPVELDVQGEIQNNQFHFREAAPTREAEQGEIADGGLGKLAAMEQAGNDVTKIFRVGKGYRFSVYDRAGERPWKIGGYVLTVLGCHHTEPDLAESFARWREYLETQGDHYPPPEQIRTIAQRLGEAL